MKETLWDNVVLCNAKQSSEPPVNCPITGFPCEGDLSYLCEDYGCARKGGLSPRSEEISADPSDGMSFRWFEYHWRRHFRPRLDETRVAHFVRGDSNSQVQVRWL